jgi:hypothetical protein
VARLTLSSKHEEDIFMAAGAAAVAIAIANALKASGVVVRVEPEDFLKILGKIEQPLVLQATGGIFSTRYQYLVSYKGFAFFTKTRTPIQLSFGTETVLVNKIWIPQ